MRHLYGNFKLTKKMQTIELKTLFRIQMITNRQMEGVFQQTNDDLVAQIGDRSQGVNPFLTMMYYRISFHTWLRQMRINRIENENADMKDFLL
jgi:hypothetical protein